MVVVSELLVQMLQDLTYQTGKTFSIIWNCLSHLKTVTFKCHHRRVHGWGPHEFCHRKCPLLVFHPYIQYVCEFIMHSTIKHGLNQSSSYAYNILTISKFASSRVFLQLRKQIKSLGAKSSEYGVCRSSSNPEFLTAAYLVIYDSLVFHVHVVCLPKQQQNASTIGTDFS